MDSGQSSNPGKPKPDEQAPGLLTPASYHWAGLTDEEAGTIDHETALIQERRARVMALYSKGRSYRYIAEQVGCSKSTVCSDVGVVFEWWRKVAVRSMGEQITDALMRLRAIEIDIEEQWERSKGEHTETTTGKRGVGQAATQHATIKKRQKYGDPKLSAQLLGCWDRRCRLLGLLKVEPGQTSDTLPPVKFVAGMDPVEVA